MALITNPILCGGTFFTLLLETKKSGVKSRERTVRKTGQNTEAKVFASLLNVCAHFPEPNFGKERSFKSQTSKFKHCSDGSPKISSFFSQSAIDNFVTGVSHEYAKYLHKMDSFVQEFIDNNEEGAIAQVVEIFLTLIKLDVNIDDSEVFYILPSGEPVAKSEFHQFLDGKKTICVPALLLGIWHFIIARRPDNSIGESTIIELTGNPIRNFWDKCACETHAKVKCSFNVEMGIPDKSLKTYDELALEIKSRFLKAADYFEIMETINRPNATFNRKDSSSFFEFCDWISNNIPKWPGADTHAGALLRKSIMDFDSSLFLQTVTLVGEMNVRYGMDDDTASFNMELRGSEDSPAMKAKVRAKTKHRDRYLKRFSMQFSKQIAAKKKLIFKNLITNWGEFRNQMNSLYENISAFGQSTES